SHCGNASSWSAHYCDAQGKVLQQYCAEEKTMGELNRKGFGYTESFPDDDDFEDDLEESYSPDRLDRWGTPDFVRYMKQRGITPLPLRKKKKHKRRTKRNR